MQGLERERDPKTRGRGRVDAAASFDKAPELHLKDPALIAQIGFVGETPEIPEAGICVRPGVPEETAAKLKRALLSIKAPEHAALLKQICDIDGFIEADDRDYQLVRDAMQLVNLNPPK